MKFSERWLREYVDPQLSTEELVEQLTMAGLEVDGFEPVASEFSKVVVGEILNVDTHPNAEKLVVCTVSSGEEELQVVKVEKYGIKKEHSELELFLNIKIRMPIKIVSLY